jgi:hypothetical protein
MSEQDQETARFERARTIAIGALDQEFTSEEQMEAWFVAQAGGDEALATNAARLCALAVTTAMFKEVLGINFSEEE